MINLEKFAPLDFGLVASIGQYQGARPFIPAYRWNIAERTGVLKCGTSAVRAQVPEWRLGEKALRFDGAVRSRAACCVLGSCPSIWRNESPAVRQAIVTGLDLRSSGGEDLGEILPKLSFRKDGMAVV